MKYKNFSYDEHISREFNITAHKKCFSGNTGVHFHEFFEIEIILGGDGACMLNGTENQLKRGNAYILTPADFHYLKATPKLELYNIMFDESLVDRELITALFEFTGNKCFSFSSEELSEISFLTEILIRERNENKLKNRKVISNTLELLLIAIIRRLGITKSNNENGSTDINYALRYIYAHLKENPSLNKVATLCNYSPNYFGKLFYEHTGEKYVDFLNYLKLSRAKKLLTLSNMTVNEIAFECGFTSISNFYRVFKEKEGCSPLSLRNKEQKK